MDDETHAILNTVLCIQTTTSMDWMSLNKQTPSLKSTVFFLNGEPLPIQPPPKI